MLETHLAILINSVPMLIPLYSYWRYRKIWGRGQDEYVARLRGDAQRAEERMGGEQLLVVENVVSGIPLETIYGVNYIHFSTSVRRGSVEMTPVGTPSGRQSRSGDHEHKHMWQSESVQNLATHAQAIGIQVHTEWTITEHTVRT